jgi:hypothetical protein
MAKLHDGETGAFIGTIDDAQLQFLADHLEEESPGDQDYYLDQPTLDMLEEEGAPPALLELLRKALSGREGMDIRWSHD